VLLLSIDGMHAVDFYNCSHGIEGANGGSPYCPNSGVRNIWAVSSIYATQSDGRLASGCRAVESMRLFWDLANMPENLRSVRDRVSRGMLASDAPVRSEQQVSALSVRGAYGVTRASRNSIEVAARQYTKLNGDRALNKAVLTMLYDSLT
jgi:hypothetical protein